MKYLILGSNGFVAQHYINYLKNKKNIEIVGLDVNDQKNKNNLKNFTFIRSSLVDRKNLKKVIIKTNPDYIIHLAAHSSVAFSWEYPYESFTNNTYCFLNLLEELRILQSKAKVLLVGSSEEYGQVKLKDIPLKETTPLNPLNPYAISRAAQEQLAKIYAKAYGVNVICTRSFNHIGPNQPNHFVVSSFIKQAVEIKLGLRKNLTCGNIDIIRDFIDVRDVITAYDLLIEFGEPGNVYNICSGKGYALKEIIDLIKKIIAIDFDVIIDNYLIRPIDNPIIIGSNKKLIKTTGFKLNYSMQESIKDMIKIELSKQKQSMPTKKALNTSINI
ncbi:MAG: GDP-mannose 4,6-dehydratase [bacterium]